MKIIMAPHSGCYNHGCEAIVRATADMLAMPKKSMILYSSDIESDKSFKIDEICSLMPNDSYQKEISALRRKRFAFRERLTKKPRNLEEISYRHKKAVSGLQETLFLSIGGDNYCYPGMQHILSELTTLFSYHEVPGILWGSSFEKSLLSEKVTRELKYYSRIIVRESVSLETLSEKGITENVFLCPDPAFTLKIQSTDLYKSVFENHECIGINVSALIRKYNAYPDATYRNIKVLIEHILRTTDCYVLLIPHVLAKGNNDLDVSRKLAEEIGSERILTVDEPLNCMQLKDIISRCRQFIGCRTHATIAAYSTCVPTLTVGYSAKAIGIAKDLFKDVRYLLTDAREFHSDNDLLTRYEGFCEREDEIKQHLETIMPEYIRRAYAAKDVFDEFCAVR